MKTNLPEATLVKLRAAGQEAKGQFVDPFVITQAKRVLNERGEQWAASVLGRDISARSRLFRRYPALRDGEEYTLVFADTEEDRWLLQQMEGDG